MEEAILLKAGELGKLLFSSEAGEDYRRTREAVYSDAGLAALLERQEMLRIKSEGEALSLGKPREETENERIKLSELLQFSDAASRYLLAEYRYTALMDSVYRLIGQEAGLRLPGGFASHESGNSSN